jgi:2-dehydro-3-deoxyphosphogluconate aldolase/(4S)-4-hydroxy-2-oxoglutarate aldolase
VVNVQIEKLMTTCPIIPVIVIDSVADAVPLAQALVNGGLKVLEVTLRTDCRLEAIKQIKAAVHGMIVGAGTVITPQDCNNAIAAGAEFLVSSGSTQALVDEAAKSDVPLLVGAAAATEVTTLLASGIKHTKFFRRKPLAELPC